jgi:hypothetical protein
MQHYSFRFALKRALPRGGYLAKERLSSAVLPLALPPSGGVMPALEETDENRPVISSPALKFPVRFAEMDCPFDSAG